MFNVFVQYPKNFISSQIEFKQFAGGEWNVKIPEEILMESPSDAVSVAIDASIHDGDIMKLAIINDALRRFFGNRVEFILNMTYLPYARQDRVMTNGESLSIKVFCDFINSMQFDKVIIDDPHSDVSSSLINNIHILEQNCWMNGVRHREYDAIVSPDAGALKKIYPQAKAASLPVIEAMKTRDIQTGVVSEPRFSADVTGKRLLIVDDICDGGRSFLNLGKALKEAGAARVDLYVTHGIFSYNAKENLAQYIDNVYSKHDWTK
ncbi:hypothetical protein HPMBJEAJ_00374 [Aeromonas phage avDM6]|nr:hypothetical protein HPMBJEAJ_00374 [Aeromonas phage avDM6]